MKAAPPRPVARLVCVGSELLAGQVNTHQAWLSVRLRRAGFAVAGEESVIDSVPAIAAALERALREADAVIVCGGLGPTFDDLTREAAAAALGRKLRFAPRLWRVIEKRFARYRSPVPAENRRQAEVIAGAAVLPNRVGSAPGQRVELVLRGKRRTLALLPGPYSEMAPIFEEQVLPGLVRRHARGLHAGSLSLRLAGVPESVADERLDPVRAAFPGAEFTILASGGEVSFHASWTAPSAAASAARRAALKKAVLGAVGRWAYGEGDDTLESALGARLKARRLTVAVAESCTGGLLGGRISSVPGSSAWFLGGIIAYANDVKVRRLGVPRRLLARDGAVSEACAKAMAEGARKAAGASLGLSVTGVAGPGGGTKKKPVGLVYVAAAGPGRGVRARELRLIGPRDAVRARSVGAALQLALEVLS